MFSGPLLQVLKKRRACPEANFTIHENNLFFSGGMKEFKLIWNIKSVTTFLMAEFEDKKLEFCQPAIKIQKHLKLKGGLKSFKLFDL